MQPSKYSVEHPERLIELEQQIEPFVHAIAEGARQAGFEHAEIEHAVTLAMQSYTRKHLRAIQLEHSKRLARN